MVQNKNMNETTATKNDLLLQREEERLRAADGDLIEESRLQDKSSTTNNNNQVDENVSPNNNPVTDFVPLGMGGSGRTHVVTEGSARLIRNEVTLEDLERMTSLFYEKAFADETLDKFIRSHKDPHGARFARWIHQKLSGSTVWDEDRRTRSQKPVRLADGFKHVVHDRSSAHVAAWYSPKRPSEEVGRHFELDESRVWMRLHFWALRESGLLETAPNFSDYYVRFIGHFVRVYESTAPPFARESLRWSAEPANIQRYIANGRRMSDVLGLTLAQARAQLPAEEAQDGVWPYNQTPRRS